MTQQFKKVTIGTKDLKTYLDNPIFEIDPAEKKILLELQMDLHGQQLVEMFKNPSY